MRCEPANTIITKFGGPTAVSRIANVSAHTVIRWRTPRERGGTGGVVPHWHVPALVSAAETLGIDVSANDFLPPALPAPNMTARAVAAAAGAELNEVQ